MRKIFALAMVALLSLSIAFAVAGCGKKSEQSSTETTTPPAEQTTPPADTGASSMTDTSHTMADTSAHK